MKKAIQLLCIIFICLGGKGQVFNKTLFSDMLSETKMSANVKTYDFAFKGNRADGEPMIKVLKILMKDGVRYEHYFDGENYTLFCTKIIDPRSTPQKGIQDMLNKGSIEKLENGMHKLKCCLIYVDIEEDDFGNTWMRFFGLPNK